MGFLFIGTSLFILCTRTCTEIEVKICMYVFVRFYMFVRVWYGVEGRNIRRT